MANLGTGRGGKSFQDRELAAKVRNEALNNIYAVLTEDPAAESWSDLKKQLVLKLAGTVLPRLNEVTGEDGAPLQVNIIKYGGDTSAQPSGTNTVSD